MPKTKLEAAARKGGINWMHKAGKGPILEARKSASENTKRTSTVADVASKSLYGASGGITSTAPVAVPKETASKPLDMFRSPIFWGAGAIAVYLMFMRN